MTAFADLSTAIQANLDARRPPLQGTAIAQAPYSTALGVVLQPDKLTIAGATLKAEDDRITLSGTADLLGMSEVAVSMGFRRSRHDCFFFVGVPVPLPGPLRVLSAFDSPLHDVTFDWQFGPISRKSDTRHPVPAAFYGFSGGFVLGAHLRLPFRVKPDSVEGAWRLFGDFAAVPLDDLAALLKRFAGQRTLPQLPTGFNALAGLQLCGLGIGIDANNQRIGDASLTIATNQSWLLLRQHISLERISLSLGYSAEHYANQHNDVRHARADSERHGRAEGATQQGR